MTTPPSPRLIEILASEKPKTIEAVVDRLRKLDAALSPEDGVTWFVKLYLEVTEAVGVAVVPGTFRDPAFLARLDVTFANLFFDALRHASRDPSKTPKACRIA